MIFFHMLILYFLDLITFRGQNRYTKIISLIFGSNEKFRICFRYQLTFSPLDSNSYRGLPRFQGSKLQSYAYIPVMQPAYFEQFSTIIIRGYSQNFLIQNIFQNPIEKKVVCFASGYLFSDHTVFLKKIIQYSTRQF